MSKRVPKYRRHPNGQAFVKCVALGPKPIYLGTFGSDASRKRYRRLLEKLEALRTAGAPPPSGSIDGMLVIELIERYRAYAKGYYAIEGRPTKEFASIDETLRSLDQLFGDEPAAEFGPRKLRELQAWLIAKGFARGVINQKIGRVKRMFRWAVAEELLEGRQLESLNAVEGLRYGRSAAKETEPVKPVPAAWVDAILPFVSPVVAAMIRLQRCCGMRPAEVCVMRGCDLLMSGDVWLYTPSQHKGSHRRQARVIAIPLSAQAIIKPFLSTQLERYLFSPIESEAWRSSQRRSKRRSPLTPSQRARSRARRRSTRLRERYDTCSYRQAIRYGIAAANRTRDEANQIPEWHPHQLRHAAATEVSRLLGQQAAQRWLGHAQLSTTGIYVEKETAELIEIARQLDSRRAI